MGDKEIPKLTVFDLDMTIWDFHCECSSPPFKKKGDKVYDKYGYEMELFPQSKEILKKLKEEGHTIAAASRTITPQYANKLLQMYDIDQYFSYKEIYPGKKITHFERLSRDSGVAHQDMIFFDDEPRNIRDISATGVTAIFLQGALTFDVVRKGIQQYINNKKKT